LKKRRTSDCGSRSCPDFSPIGGSSRLLNQFAADATGRRTIADGKLASLAQFLEPFKPENGVSCRGCNPGREAAEAGLSILKEFLNRRFPVKNSIPVEEFQPSANLEWNSAFARFEKIRG